MILRIDMHVHTMYSYDSNITPKKLVFYSKSRNLDGVAITDHDTCDGLQRFKKIKNLLVIPGEEITTTQGHILAINPNTCILSGLSFAETIDSIHDADGLAILAHPTGFLKGIDEETLHPNFDAIEVINSSAFPFLHSVERNNKLAEKLGFPQIAGSDAHYAPEIGMAYTLIKAENEVYSVIKAIEQGKVTPFGRAIPVTIRLKRIFSRVKKRF